GPGPCRPELVDPSVIVGLAGADELVAPPELDVDAGRGPPALGVEDVGRDRHRHSLAASARCSRAISSSLARTRVPPATTFSPPTYSVSTRCGPESTSPAIRSSAPPSSRPSVAPPAT